MNKSIDREGTLKDNLDGILARCWHYARDGRVDVPRELILSLILKHLEEKLTVMDDSKLIEETYRNSRYIATIPFRRIPLYKEQQLQHSLAQIKEILNQ